MLLLNSAAVALCHVNLVVLLHYTTLAVTHCVVECVTGDGCQDHFAGHRSSEEETSSRTRTHRDSDDAG